MEHTMTIIHMNEMARRFTAGFTLRQALVNMAKDTLRVRINEGSYQRRSTDVPTFLHIALEYELRALWIAAGTTSKVWFVNMTPFGQVRELTDFGKWLLKLQSYYGSLTDKQLDSILADAIRKVGEPDVLASN